MIDATTRTRLVFLFALVAVVGCGGEGEGASEVPSRGAAADRTAWPDGVEPGAEERAAPEPVVVPAGAPLVVFVGDSISAGLHLPESEAFPAVLQRELAARGLPFRVENAGVSGDTSAGGLARIDWLLELGPDVVVVELGGNDGLRGRAVEGIERDLDEILRRIRAAGARALLLGMRMPPNYGLDYTRGFEALYERLAEKHDVAFVPYFMEGVGGVPSMNLPDGLHPTPEGHERLAENVLPALRELLED